MVFSRSSTAVVEKDEQPSQVRTGERAVKEAKVAICPELLFGWYFGW